MKIDYFVMDANHLTREIKRPFIYGIRHLRLAFNKTIKKTERIGLKAINDSNQQKTRISLKGRITHAILGFVELLPVVNYVIALLDLKANEDKTIINDKLPDNQLRGDEIIESTKQSVVDKIYDIFEAMQEIFNERSIKYCLACGSQLGVTRHKGLIRWDDDGDVVAHVKDKKKILNLRKVFNRKGFDLYYAPLFGIIHIFKNGDQKRYPAVDVFLIKEKGERLVYTGPLSYKIWGKTEYLTKSDWNENITDLPFGHLTLKGLSQNAAQRYLKRAYGTRCLTTGMKTHYHEDLLVTPPMERVRIDNFDPARHSQR